MIITAKPLKVKVIQSQNALYDFMHINTAVNQEPVNSKDVIFVRYIGVSDSTECYTQDILNLDKHFTRTVTLCPYLRLSTLNTFISTDDIARLSNILEHYQSPASGSANRAASKQGPFLCAPLDNPALEWSKKLAFDKVLSLYNRVQTNSNATTYKNFCIKFLFWMESFLPVLFPSGTGLYASPKVVFTGDIKRHELLFLYFLSQLGCDILYMNYKNDIINAYPEAAGFSTLQSCGKIYSGSITIPTFSPPGKAEQAALTVPAVAAKRPQPSGNTTPAAITTVPVNAQPAANAAPPRAVEYNYEQLAQLSASVVMIRVYDNSNKPFASGSGVVINKEGYILTNFHVVAGGSRYSVLFENDAAEYTTFDIVKYHKEYDLAVIKVDRTCIPLPVNGAGSLLRGQKIVAIGSPLGLFNSISDGIVSGFREINNMPMIQFTAPISNGSSGGALLDMFGRLVGLITAGFDAGQNLNLAVPADIIRFFAGNYIGF